MISDELIILPHNVTKAYLNSPLRRMPAWLSPRGKWVYVGEDRRISNYNQWEYEFAHRHLKREKGWDWDDKIKLNQKNWAFFRCSHSSPRYEWYFTIGPKGFTKTQEKVFKSMGIDYKVRDGIRKDHDTGLRYQFGRIGIDTTENFRKYWPAEFAYQICTNMYIRFKIKNLINEYDREDEIMAFEYLKSVEDAKRIYVIFVVNGMDEQRVKMHKKLCEMLDLPYEEFRPFEDEAMPELLSEKKALEMLNEAIREAKKDD